MDFSGYIGKRDVRREKTTKSQTGHEFTELRAAETAKRLDQRIKERFGSEIREDDERPWPGAFAIVSENMVATWLHLLETNGLRRFSDLLLVDWFIKVEEVPEDPNEIVVYPAPIASEPLFRFPRNRNELAGLLFRIVLIDPQFLDENNRPKYKAMPARYIEAVINGMNPLALYQVYRERIPELIKRAGKQGPGFEQLMKYMDQKWKNKQAPSDYATFQEWISFGFIHEAVHALALHMPDAIPADLPAKEQEHLRSISFEKYLGIINSDKSLQTSAVFAKNLYKALLRVSDQEPSNKTQSDINVLLALEMFCDRFSMYLYENYLKVKIYNQVLRAHRGFDINIDQMIVLETARRSGTLTNEALMQGITPQEISKLEQDLTAAESYHIFISAFGDTQITSAEYGFFNAFLDLLKQFDNESKILRFTMQHADTSRFILNTVSGLTQEMSLSMAGFIREDAWHLSGPDGKISPTLQDRRRSWR